MKTIKEELAEWVAKDGSRVVISGLMNEGLAPSTSYALAKGTYSSEPKELMERAIRAAIAKKASKAS